MKPLVISSLVAKVPVVQGGMGVGISLSGLAGAVARAGGIGVISGVEIGFNWPGYKTDRRRANREAMAWQLGEARRIAPGGIIGVNIMVALTDYEETVASALAGGADIIFSGAGLPLSLPQLAAGSSACLVPIISSAKAAALLVRHWRQKHGRLPDAFVLEGPLAGGHLGFSREQLTDTSGSYSLIRLLDEVLAALQALDVSIPVIAAGGIWDCAEVKELLDRGAAGVQISSRFVTTQECDAPHVFKQAYVWAGQADIGLIDSPVGLPGRAIDNSFLAAVEREETRPSRCRANCIRTCGRLSAPYCIADALINAATGNLSSGFVFAGANAWRAEEISTVPAVMADLLSCL